MITIMICIISVFRSEKLFWRNLWITADEFRPRIKSKIADKLSSEWVQNLFDLGRTKEIFEPSQTQKKRMRYAKFLCTPGETLEPSISLFKSNKYCFEAFSKRLEKIKKRDKINSKTTISNKKIYKNFLTDIFCRNITQNLGLAHPYDYLFFVAFYQTVNQTESKLFYRKIS